MIFRIRAAAIILNDKNELLLVRHRHPKTGEEWWTPPGGGLEGEETAPNAAMREVKEECNINCIAQRLVYVREFLDCRDNIHHMELFFTAEIQNDDIKRGVDPELEEQFITDVKFLSKEQIKNASIAIYPEILRDTFWQDLQCDFIGHVCYLGQQTWRK